MCAAAEALSHPYFLSAPPPTPPHRLPHPPLREDNPLQVTGHKTHLLLLACLSFAFQFSTAPPLFVGVGVSVSCLSPSHHALLYVCMCVMLCCRALVGPLLHQPRRPGHHQQGVTHHHPANAARQQQQQQHLALRRQRQQPFMQQAQPALPGRQRERGVCVEGKSGSTARQAWLLYQGSASCTACVSSRSGSSSDVCFQEQALNCIVACTDMHRPSFPFSVG